MPKANLKNTLSPANLLNKQHLYWLLASLALILAIHTPNLPIWVTASCGLFGGWRYFAVNQPLLMPNRWLLMLLSLLVGLAVLLSFKGQFGRDASLSLLVLMTVLKLLETRVIRDYIFTVMLAYFLIGNLFLFNQSMLTFALSIPPLILLTATLIHVSLKSPQNWQFLLKLAGKMLLQSVPVMLILFVLFPRIPGPLWGIPQDAYSGMTGLGDNLKFGNISNLTINSSVAFRVQFKGKLPPNNQLYWRGPVLWHQNGNEWLMPSKRIGLRNEILATTGTAFDYTITLEPHNRNWLLLLDMPTLAPAGGNFTHDYSAVSNQPVRKRIRYSASSHPNYQLGTTLGEREQVLSLQFTEGENPRTFELVKSWQDLSPQQKINKALQMFRDQPFIYTLRPPILSENPIDEFLFNTKRGFCEHYATSFVYLMRAAGVPARIVTGYQGGELNPNGNYLIVRQSDAHAWTEVWLQGQGWVRVDPTAAVSPERIEQGISEALRDNSELPLLARGDYPLLKKAFLNFDSINNSWNQWVLGYDDKKQLEFLNQLTGKKLGLSDLVFWMTGAIVLVMVATSYFLFRQVKAKLNPAQQLYQQYLHKLKRVNLQPTTGEGALDFASRAAQSLPSHQQQILQIASSYNALQYSEQPNDRVQSDILKQLESLVAQLNIKKPYY